MAPKNSNGKMWMWAIGILVTLGLAAISTMSAMGVFQGEVKRDIVHNHEAIEDNQDDLLMNWIKTDENTEHRHRFEEKVNTMAESIETIRKAVEK